MSRRIYFGGDILTLEGEGRADYLVAENGKIKGAGKGTPPVLSADTEKIDLKGRTLLPAFIDPHSHISACASKFLQLDLENCKTNEKIEKAIAQFISENKTPCGEWVFASGYDHTRVEGKRLTAELLDRAAPDNPLVVQYQSGHMGIFNSAAMKLLGVAADTKPLEGGVIERNADGAPTGYMEETDFVTRLQSVPMPDGKKLLGAFDRAQELYFSNGIVMMQEGLGVKELLPLYQGIAAAGRLKADVVIYPDLAAYEAYAEAIPARLSCGSGSLKLGGVKLISDGSPQGRTAWMRTPYLDESGRPESDGYCGYPSVSQETLENAVRFATKKKLQLLVHCNGDRAAEKFIEAEINYGDPATRPVMIHAQLLGTDQLDALKRAAIIPSFFVAHVLHWGDVHIKNFGFERASSISPLRSALKKDILFTLHQDSPVIRPDMTETIWCAVERKTAGGKTLGEEERIDVFSALKAVTANAAYQYFEEKTTGTLKTGKRENLVVLSENPLRCPAEKLRDIRVEQTIKDGETVFRL
ncbi:MAG: amidohydrolase [Christensenellaceae bacterium]|jgi:hypothetical protein|nr:amidohydrolase [Clostridia bacterium]PWL98841.1 MAG: amidohydrolase [Clostridiales bacterium]